MKNRYKGMVALIILSYVIVGIFLAFMPEQVPMHYNMAGEVDRFGSKYENLIIPVAFTVMGIIMIALARAQGKKGESGNEKVILVTGIATMLFENILNVYLLWKALSIASGSVAENTAMDTTKFAAIGFGVLVIFLSNKMPKASMNGVFGLRTSWSMKNERIWQKSQRFAGYSGILCGFLMILCGIFLSETTVMIAATGIIVVWCVASMLVSYRIYKADGQNE